MLMLMISLPLVLLLDKHMRLLKQDLASKDLGALNYILGIEATPTKEDTTKVHH